MKKLLVMALVLFTMNGIAQERKQERPDRKEQRKNMSNMSPEDRASLKSKHLTLKLDLTEAQQSQVYSLLLTEAKSKDVIKTKQKEKSAENSKPSKAEITSFKIDQLDRKIEMKRKMKVILDTEQYEKFEKIMAQNQNKKSKKHRPKN